MPATANRRASAIGTPLPFIILVPAPDGDIANETDRQHIAGMYAIEPTADDLLPDSFSFGARVGIAQSATNIESDLVTVAGINSQVDVTFAGDASLEWSKNAGAWSTGATTAVEGDTFRLRLDASASYLTQVSGVATIGTGTGGFSVTTLVDPASIVDNIIVESVNKQASRGIARKING